MFCMLHKSLKIFVIFIICNNCTKEIPEPKLEIIINPLITSTESSGTAKILFSGGPLIKERGVCWSTNSNPTVSDNIKKYGSGDGSFEWSISGLIAETDYYIRSFAKSDDGIFYSEQISIKTKSPISSFFRTFGGTSSDNASCIINTIDKGFIITGSTSSSNGDFFGASFKGFNDVVIMKFNSDGQKEWVKLFGGSDVDDGHSICQSSNGSYYITGKFGIYNGDFAGLGWGGQDIFIIKLKLNGEAEWIKAITGSGDLTVNSITSTTDNGCVIIGSFNKNDGDFSTLNKGGLDVFAIKLNLNGVIQWKTSIGGTTNDAGYSISKTSDNGYIIAGLTQSSDGDIIGANKGSNDILVVKLNSIGEKEWVKTFGGTGIDFCRSIDISNDGGYILTGSTYSNDGDFLGLSIGKEDMFLLKINSYGEKQWAKVYGGTNADIARSVKQTSDGGFVITGAFTSLDGDFNVINKGAQDIFILKTNTNGEKQWIKSFGGSLIDRAHSVVVSTDEGIVVSGTFASSDGDFIKKNRGSNDIFIIKLNPFGNLSE